MPDERENLHKAAEALVKSLLPLGTAYMEMGTFNETLKSEVITPQIAIAIARQILDHTTKLMSNLDAVQEKAANLNAAIATLEQHWRPNDQTHNQL